MSENARKETTDLIERVARALKPECPHCGGDTDHECIHCRPRAKVEVGARFEFPSGHAIGVHELWRGQWLYQVWQPGVETQGQFDRLIRMPADEFEQEVAARGGVRVR